MTEVWKPIKGYENLYMISNKGRVKSLGRYSIRKDGKPCHYPSKMMSLCNSTKGYLIVGLTKNGKCTTYLVHRLVSDAFIPNPEGLPQVNHINEDKTDNRACNLEWMSCADNVNHGTGKVRCGKAHEYPVVMIMPDGSETEFSSATAAANALGIVSTGIQQCCTGRIHSYKGCRWRYKDRHRARIEVPHD